MNINYKRSIIDAGKVLLEKNLTVDTWGNISIRDKNTGRIYLTPSAMDYNMCTEDDVVVCDMEGNILEGKRKPTIEKVLHLLIYKNRSDINAIVHTHPIYSLVFACLKETIPQIIDEAAQAIGGEVKVADYALPGTIELAENCLNALGEKSMACLLQSHGAVCTGKDLKEAFKTATVLEMTSKVYYMARTIGKPVPISDEDIKYMRDFALNKYGK